jgi:hypothetical protein
MPRHAILLTALAATTIAFGGCRSCDSCNDYGPPVANCQCDACGTHRAGSASGGYIAGQPITGEYVEGEYLEGAYPVDGQLSEPIEGQVMEPVN